VVVAVVVVGAPILPSSSSSSVMESQLNPSVSDADDDATPPPSVLQLPELLGQELLLPHVDDPGDIHNNDGKEEEDDDDDDDGLRSGNDTSSSSRWVAVISFGSINTTTSDGCGHNRIPPFCASKVPVPRDRRTAVQVVVVVVAVVPVPHLRCDGGGEECQNVMTRSNNLSINQ
jgi:hypothetical protein